jgi:hypothetical protein
MRDLTRERIIAQGPRGGKEGRAREMFVVWKWVITLIEAIDVGLSTDMKRING